MSNADEPKELSDAEDQLDILRRQHQLQIEKLRDEHAVALGIVTKERDELTQKLKSTNVRVEELVAENSSLAIDCADLRDQLNEVDALQADVTAKLDHIKGDLLREHAENEQLRQESGSTRTANRETNASLETNQKQLQEKIALLETDRKTDQDRITSLEYIQGIMQVEIDELDQAHEKNRLLTEELEAARRALWDHGVELNARLESAREYTAGFETTITTSTARLNELKTELLTSRTHVAELESKLPAEGSTAKIAISEVTHTCTVLVERITPNSKAIKGLHSQNGDTLTWQERQENLRKTYIDVKSKYGELRATSASVTQSCQGMNMKDFGRFGGRIRALEKALADNGGPRQDFVVSRIGGS